ncbi:permease [Vibrio sp. HA2012]|uniref:sulfite exporter TauE/SafE family protein n=1 Tax=Vibrio sp. HA2012 TaxID=1971595 RepID=UPI000C2BB1E2|nr:sulfite exporter TauE/SafE family protein [Vibrio sp. HA2012]PJC86646.1 permease [Vibrio sp. HA2012]
MEYLVSPTVVSIVLIFIGSFVQTAIGFGLAVVAAPFLFTLSPDYVPAPVTLCALVLSVLNALKLRNNISVGGLKMAILGRIPGSVIGGLLLVWVSTQILELWLGLLVLMAVIISLLPFRFEPTPRRMVIAGFFSGFFGTSSAIGGPPMALLLQHQDANQLRGNLAAFFCFSSMISLVVQMYAGFLTWHHLTITLPLIPAVVLGYFCAIKFTRNWPKDTVRKSALLLCSVSGVTAVLKGTGLL